MKKILTMFVLAACTLPFASQAKAMTNKVKDEQLQSKSSREDIDSNQYKYAGYQVKYDYVGHPKEREIAYQYYLDYWQKSLPKVTKAQLGVGLYDLDDDGKQEIILYINGGDYCPHAGCPFTTLRVLNVESKKYQVINWSTENNDCFFSHGASPKILNVKTNGYHDIWWEDNDQKDYDFYSYRWTGKYYSYYSIKSKK